MIDKPITELSLDVFKVFQKIIFVETGISLDSTKLSLVKSRLYKRLLYYKVTSYSEYLRIVQVDHQEKMEMINRITTNETYFFREKEQFDFLVEYLNTHTGSLRLWSAASSVGAEAYTLAMILDYHLCHSQWEVIGTDINSDVLKKARMGLYPLSWIDKIPQEYRKKYCLKGKGKFDKQFLIDRTLSRHLKFFSHNLMNKNQDIGRFDIIFLRNVLIYFNDKIKREVVQTISENLRSGGLLVISLTESLQHLELDCFVQIQSSIYKKR